MLIMVYIPHQLHGGTARTSPQQLAVLVSPVEGVVYLGSEAAFVLSGPKRAGVVFRAAEEEKSKHFQCLLLS